jgi:hypothetical protein
VNTELLGGEDLRDPVGIEERERGKPKLGVSCHFQIPRSQGDYLDSLTICLLINQNKVELLKILL